MKSPLLNPSQIAQWQEQGFLLIEDFASKTERTALRNRAGELVQELSHEWDQATFSTEDQESSSNTYFLESGDKVRIFMEAENPTTPNKLGHALHEIDPAFSAFTKQERFARLAREIGFVEPKPLQSMYIFKEPGCGGKVESHQDSAFLYTEPMSVVGFWLAIDDADQENGCLWALPGGHKTSLRQRMVRDGNGGVKFITLDSAPLPEEGYVPIEVPAGGLVLLHGLLPHFSYANRSTRARHAYTLHMIEGTAAYPAENWLQAST